MSGKKMSFDAYLKEIHEGLMESSWQYSSEQAKDHMDMEMHYIRAAYERDEPVDDVVAEVGFGCG